MRRIVALALFCTVALGACSSASGASSPAPSYTGPDAMSSKAWSAAGLTSCGEVDEVATFKGGHAVQCQAGSADVRFAVADSDAHAADIAAAFESLGLKAMQRGAWVVAADDPKVLDAAVSALG